MRVHLLASLMLCAAAAAAQENLLGNPGFEQIAGDAPARWNVFVMPMEGAYARLDEQNPHEGKFSALIHNPEPYAREPANNWSQNVFADVAGKDLIAQAYIRTEDATEAAIWIQCCRRTPFAVLKSASSAAAHPITGTTEWTKVEAKLRVPPGTDYLILRCVLKGYGSVWFDSLTLHEPEVVKPATQAGLNPPAPRDEKRQDPAPRTQPPPKPAPSRPQAKAPAPALEPAPPAVRDEVTQSLVETNRALIEAARSLREANEALADQVSDLQRELNEIRAALPAPVSSVPDDTMTPDEAPNQQPQGPPPLVPKGYDYKKELGE